MFMRIGARMLERTSPAGMAVAGTLLALSFPAVRKGLRWAAVMAARGIFVVSDTVSHASTVIKEEIEDIITKARETDCPLCASLEVGQRRLATATSSGLMSVSHKAKFLSEKVKRFAENDDYVNNPETLDGLETEN